MIELEELLKNWFVLKEQYSKKELLSLLLKLTTSDRKSRCYFSSHMPYDIFDKKTGITWKDYIHKRDMDSFIVFARSLCEARRRAKLSWEKMQKITGISYYYLDEIECCGDERRFLEFITFLKACGCIWEFGVTKDLLHTRYYPVNSLMELGIFYKKIRNRHHWSFQKLSQESGYPVPMLKRLEHGNLNPTVVMMRRVIKSYDLELMTRAKQF